MILGTAQLGMEYGIHNTTGKPDKENVFKILDYAWQHGITVLDTAGTYGDSENLIGSYQNSSGHTFRICTKTVTDTAADLAYGLDNSLKNLMCEQIWIYYLHRFDSCKNSDVMQAMRVAKDQGKISNIGISIYEPVELEYILNHLTDVVDVVQIPFNLLDHVRWQESALLEKAKEKNIRIFARSIFLQGLFLQKPDSEISRKLMASEVLEELCRIAKDCSISIQQLAVSFVFAQPYIDDILLGCETVEQLAQNIDLTEYVNRKKLPDGAIYQLAELSLRVHENVIDPRKWNVR